MMLFFDTKCSRLFFISSMFATLALALWAGQCGGTLLWAPMGQNEAMALDGIWVGSMGRQQQQQKVHLRQLLHASPSFRPTAPSVFRFSSLGAAHRFTPADTPTAWADKRASLLARLASQSARGFGRK